MPSLELVPLSPSRASDFKTCPQLFKYRVIDRLFEPAEVPSMRGTLVHAVLEQLFRLDAPDRVLDRAEEIIAASWETMKAGEELAELEIAESEESQLLSEALELLQNYFAIEDPVRVTPKELEWWVEHEGDTTFMRGIIDRVEVAADGRWVLSDYKTGRSPSETYELGAFFGLKFYALVCWRAFGQLPAELRLIHLKKPEVITLIPTQTMLEGLERQLSAIAGAIVRAEATGDWRPRPSRLCSWCPHQAICPAFSSGGLAGSAPVQTALELVV